MENASKALLIAASVLIGVMILSLGIYLFSIFGNTSSSISERMKQAQIDEFNSNFTKFDGQENCTIHNIISLVNLAKSNNQNYDYNNADIEAYNADWSSTNKITNGSAPNYIYVGIKGVDSKDRGLKQSASTDELIDLMKRYSTEEVISQDGSKGMKTVYFKCVGITFNEITKKVQGIVFSKL